MPPPLPVPPAGDPAWTALLTLPTAVLGACVGSFLNVVAWRLPRQRSLISPGSHCPLCGSGLAWFENLPVLSWVLLRGRCRHCQRPISPRYPLVELLCSGLWVAMLHARPAAMGAAGPWSLLLSGWLLASLLLPLVLIDLDSLWLPEPLCRWGVLLGLAATALNGFGRSAAIGRELLLSHLIAAAVALVALEAVSGLGERLFGRPALGLGDAKLAAVIGAWLGPTGLALALALAVLAGAVLGSLGRLSGRLSRHQPIPFGPFLAAGTLAVWIAGHDPWLQFLGLGSRHGLAL